MKRHDILDEGQRERAALMALGALPPEEARAFEAHSRGCDVCRREVEELRRAAAGIDHLAPEVTPPASLRGRLLDRARRESDPASGRAGQPWKAWPADRAGAAMVMARAAEAAWEPSGYPGVESRRLFVDEEGDRVTMLIRMAAGASYPAHRHGGPEECLVLEGDLLSGGTRMTAGDYKRAASGSVDGIQSTDDGCLLLIVSSMHDELLSGRAD